MCADRLGISDDFLLTVGTIEPRKNLTTLVSAFEEHARARPLSTLQLVIAGKRGWLSEPLLDDSRKVASAEAHRLYRIP